jgi:enterobactin synthetase component D
MQLIPIPTPRVLPDFVACYSARIPGGEGRLHFAAGRECASRAIEQLLGAPSPDALPRGPAGEPVWPAGLTGSITHTGDFVAAAVAPSSMARGLGLDAEQVVSPERAARVASIVTQPGEACLGPQTVSDALRVTLLFSIKEAVFKCLYPLVLTRFYYPALLVTGLDFDQGIFHAELALPLPGGFASGYPLSGRFQIEDSRVYSGVCLVERDLS